MEFLIYLIFAWFLCITSILLFFARDLLALWREPVLKYPVMIIESDDWGAGPLSQASALTRLSSILCSHFDGMGNHPIMTIAVILALPNGEVIRSTGVYNRATLDDQTFAPILQALQDGIDGDVFFPQLHGMEHYWPSTLMQCDDVDVQKWLRQTEPQTTEKLPSHLQSRWVDAGKLPSVPLTATAIESAVNEETTLYANILKQPAKVAVPPTFVWNDTVESAWARQGVEFLVTPGRRYSSRDREGAPSGSGLEIRNGDWGKGVIYLVRNDYFEPEKGHDAEHALSALQSKTRQGRPCLLETHRSNFLGKSSEKSFQALDSLLGRAVMLFPNLRNISTLELGQSISERDDELIEQKTIHRIRPWIFRLDELPRFAKLAQLTGLLFTLHLLGRFVLVLSPSQSGGEMA